MGVTRSCHFKHKYVHFTVLVPFLDPVFLLKKELNAQSTYIHIKSTTMYVPSSESGLSQPLSRQRVCPSPQNRGEGHTRLWVRGWGSPNSDDWRISLALCLLCGSTFFMIRLTLLMFFLRNLQYIDCLFSDCLEDN